MTDRWSIWVVHLPPETTLQTPSACIVRTVSELADADGLHVVGIGSAGAPERGEPIPEMLLKAPVLGLGRPGTALPPKPAGAPWELRALVTRRSPVPTARLAWRARLAWVLAYRELLTGQASDRRDALVVRGLTRLRAMMPHPTEPMALAAGLELTVEVALAGRWQDDNGTWAPWLPGPVWDPEVKAGWLAEYLATAIDAQAQRGTVDLRLASTALLLAAHRVQGLGRVDEPFDWAAEASVTLASDVAVTATHHPDDS